MFLGFPLGSPPLPQVHLLALASTRGSCRSCSHRVSRHGERNAIDKEGKMRSTTTVKVAGGSP